MRKHPFAAGATLLATIALVAGCGGSDHDELPRLTPATGAALTSCTDLGIRFSFAGTSISAASAVSAGTLAVAGTPVAAHCLVTGFT